MYESCFCVHSPSLCLFVGPLNPFTFKVIVDLYVPVAIFLVVLSLFFRYFKFFFWLCFLPREVPLVLVVNLVLW